jgi:hypothetical protein
MHSTYIQINSVTLCHINRHLHAVFCSILMHYNTSFARIMAVCIPCMHSVVYACFFAHIIADYVTFFRICMSHCMHYVASHCMLRIRLLHSCLCCILSQLHAITTACHYITELPAFCVAGFSCIPDVTAFLLHALTCILRIRVLHSCLCCMLSQLHAITTCMSYMSLHYSGACILQ